MKISNSKQELARIISENGGWREGNHAIQDKDDKCVWFMTKMKGRPSGKAFWPGCKSDRIKLDKLLPNWHQTILSRDEYFHLYPSPDTDGWIEWKGGSIDIDDLQLVDYKMRCTPQGSHLTTASMNLVWDKAGEPFDIIAYRLHKPGQAVPEFCESVMRSIPEPEINSKNINTTQVDDIGVVESKPSIEQLAADYRNAKDYAERKQKEADNAKADVGAKLKALKLAGKEYGLLVSPITAKQDPEPELVIKAQVGDEVECIKSNVTPDNFRGMIGTVLKIDCSSTPYLVDFGRYITIWCREVKFIRRP